MEKPSKETLENWHNDSKNWKLIVFYYNKEDFRLMVDKRNPNYGITLNFANPKSYLISVIALSFIGFVLYMVTYK